MPAQVLVKRLDKKVVEKLVTDAQVGDLVTISDYESALLVAARDFPHDPSKHEMASAAVQMVADADSAARKKP